MNDDARPRLNILVSFAYWKDEIAARLQERADDVRLLIDSGAFTAWTAGKPITLAQYSGFLARLPVAPWRYFTLDVIGDAAGTARNYEALLEGGYKPVPIFTRGEKPAALDRLYKTSDVVGIGGLVKTQGNRAFINGIMRHVAGRRVHWLGVLNTEFIRHYRPYMADSSTWSVGSRYGRMNLYFGGARFSQLDRSKFMERPTPEIEEAVRRVGMRPSDFARAEMWEKGALREICARSFVAYMLDVQANIRTLVFAAMNNLDDLDMLLRAYDQLKPRETNR